MSSNFSPKDFVYNGTKYRSKTEARWAIYFDRLGIRAVHEARTFDLSDHVLYTPDFYLVDLDVWVEVKPEASNIRNAERWKVDQLASTLSHGRVWLTYGQPNRFDQLATCDGCAIFNASLHCDAAGFWTERDGFKARETVWVVGTKSAHINSGLKIDPVQVIKDAPWSAPLPAKLDLDEWMALSNSDGELVPDFSNMDVETDRMSKNHQIRRGGGGGFLGSLED